MKTIELLAGEVNDLKGLKTETITIEEGVLYDLIYYY